MDITPKRHRFMWYLGVAMTCVLSDLSWAAQNQGGGLHLPDFADRLTVLVVAGVLLSGILVTLIRLRRASDRSDQWGANSEVKP